jgi:hypothetical protein
VARSSEQFHARRERPKTARVLKILFFIVYTKPLKSCTHESNHPGVKDKILLRKMLVNKSKKN